MRAVIRPLGDWTVSKSPSIRFHTFLGVDIHIPFRYSRSKAQQKLKLRNSVRVPRG